MRTLPCLTAESAGSREECPMVFPSWEVAPGNSQEGRPGAASAQSHWAEALSFGGQSRRHPLLSWQAEPKSSKARSPRLHERQKAVKPWVWTVGSHVRPARSSQHQAPSCPSLGTERKRPGQGRQPNTKSPGKRLQQKYAQHQCLLLSTCTWLKAHAPELDGLGPEPSTATLAV